MQERKNIFQYKRVDKIRKKGYTESRKKKKRKKERMEERMEKKELCNNIF